MADDGLRLAARMARHPARVDVRGVDEVEAEVHEAVEDREGGFLVGGPAEDIAAEAERRGAEAGAAEGSFVHRSIIACAAPSRSPTGVPPAGARSSRGRSACTPNRSRDASTRSCRRGPRAASW